MNFIKGLAGGLLGFLGGAVVLTIVLPAELVAGSPVIAAISEPEPQVIRIAIQR